MIAERLQIAIGCSYSPCYAATPRKYRYTVLHVTQRIRRALA
jgi:hypothetical protein